MLAWSGAPVAVDSRQILRVHGYGDGKGVRPAIRAAAERVAAHVGELAEPVANYRRMQVVACNGGTLRLGDGTTLTCAAFDRLLGGCPEVVVFVLTLGPGIDQSVDELMEEFEPLDALFTETAGWLAIERATRVFAKALGQDLISENLTLCHRMGPGYSYRTGAGSEDRSEWSLEDQVHLFAVFEGAELPVTLMQSCAMTPKMSRSGLFGVRPLNGNA